MSMCELQGTVLGQAEHNIEVAETQWLTRHRQLFPDPNIIQLERGSDRPAGVYARLQFSVLDDCDTVDEDILYAFSIFGGLLES
jgi:hypothetical protein